MSTPEERTALIARLPSESKALPLIRELMAENAAGAALLREARDLLTEIQETWHAKRWEFERQTARASLDQLAGANAILAKLDAALGYEQ